MLVSLSIAYFQRAVIQAATLHHSQSYPFSLLCRLLKTNPSDLVSAALKVFTDVAKEKFKAAIAKEEEEEKKALKSTVED
ncbi:hypothetical protein BFJ68_g13570 [Fusarium oxysporum]|uniref:Uncharacterized protein n=1 Tax=Fusarium oxysporum TaxID=5507 RepID=A0A420Q135_FUSOX|nr:hypothetical protein BFJ68_g13570 [Fusarium oxysporum]